MTIKCIAIDDEPLAIHKIELYTKQLPSISLINTFNNASDALDFLSKNETDLIFLDIEMEKMTGIEFLSALPKQTPVIFTTAYSEFALKSYEFEVVDYLLKPFSFERFAKATAKAENRITLRKNPFNEILSFIFVKTDSRFVRIMHDDIYYIEGMRDFRCIFTRNSKILTPFTFGKLSEILPSENFIRVHKSYMVALQKIESIEKHRIKIGNKRIPISESYREIFYNTIGAKN
jgi:DNA-binding LytR/AlgR family response regulator